MERAVVDLVVPVMSLATALIAVSFWRRLPEGGRFIGRDRNGNTSRPGPVDVPGQADNGVLELHGAQLLGTQLEGSDLIIDAFGGSGTWCAYAGDVLVEQGQVSGTPMLTFRASFDSTIDITALERLLAWSESSCCLDLVVEVDGDSPLQTPTRITITDHAQAVSLLTAAV